MIDRNEITSILDEYETDNVKIGLVGSHSALDVCDGAIEEGFQTHLVCQAGRERTYTEYFKAKRDPSGNLLRGIVDDAVVYSRFDEVLQPKNQQYLRDNSILFVPNRSFTSYCSIDAIENDFAVPMVGSRNLLRSEERGGEEDYYWLLEKAGLPYPERIDDPEDIDELVMVKLPHAVKKLERGFFTASDYNEYLEKSKSLIRQGVITEDALSAARIERYVVGPVFNLHFFYSPIEDTMSKTELIGIDWRFETSLDGHVRLPAPQQMTLAEHQLVPEYTVCGHNSGIIGPFCLQTCVDKDLNFYIYDVAPRIGGGTNVHVSVGHPYGNALWRRNMSTGRRLAMEVRRAVDAGRVAEIVT